MGRKNERTDTRMAIATNEFNNTSNNCFYAVTSNNIIHIYVLDPHFSHKLLIEAV